LNASDGWGRPKPIASNRSRYAHGATPTKRLKATGLVSNDWYPQLPPMASINRRGQFRSLGITRSTDTAQVNSKCHCCRHSMWSTDPKCFAHALRITARQARHLQCSAEHLKAGCKGGRVAHNIAASCRFCNLHRHPDRHKSTPSPDDRRSHVQTRMSHGTWHKMLSGTEGLARHGRAMSP